MRTSSVRPKTGNKETIVLLISAILITAFLFFIDEGYYNFQWMTSIGNWIVFPVYAGAIFLGQLLMAKVLLRKYGGRLKTPLSILGGAIIGVLFVMGVIFTN